MPQDANLSYFFRFTSLVSGSVSFLRRRVYLIHSYWLYSLRDNRAIYSP
jgi:hypothetical protein